MFGCRHADRGHRLLLGFLPRMRRIHRLGRHGFSTNSNNNNSNNNISSTLQPAVVKVHNLLDHGCLSYPQTWAFQQMVLHKRLQERRHGSKHVNDDCVVFLEQSPVYTLGRGADEHHLTFCNDKEYASELQKLSRKVRGPGTARLSMDKELEARMTQLLSTTANTTSNDSVSSLLEISQDWTDSISPVVAPNGVPVYRVDRGGEVTFHGPSQLVVYPMLDLKRDCYKADLHWYLRQIEETVIKLLNRYGIQGTRDDINTGVWVDQNKIAAVGISSSRWITTHGFALNVNPDLGCFDTSLILPCGIEGRGVTSMGQILEKVPTLQEVAGCVTETMQDVFGVELVQGDDVL